MKFYDLNRNCIGLSAWINLYRPFYFLDGPKFDRRICRKNQSSPFVEEAIINILKPNYTIKTEDIPLIMAWKVGAIDHAKSIDQQIIYKPRWLENYSYTGRGGSKSLKIAIEKIKEKLSKLLIMKQKSLYDEFKSGDYPGIGSVYALTLVYFFTKGKFPIIDTLAYIASEAIINEIKPNDHFNNSQIDWNIYQKYMCNLVKIFGTYSIGRPIDQTLWCYGHWFNQKSGPKIRCDSNCG